MEEKASGQFTKSYGKYIVTLFLFMVACSALLYLTYQNVKREMIEGLNARQMIHAKQAARGIENFFGDHIKILQSFSKNEHIIAFDESGKKLMREFLLTHGGETSIISRMDGQGRILYAEPYNSSVIGQPVTKMEDFLHAKRTHQVTVSDVFTNRRGFQSIIVHAPVFKNGNFNGTLALLVSFDFIAKRYIDDIRIGKDGYAWMISRNGIELSCPIPGHVGNSVFDNCRAFPDILAMAERMIRGEQDVTTYIFDRIRGESVSKTTKHAVFMPINLGNTFWSIVVATPEEEVTDALNQFRNRLLLIAILLVIGLGYLVYTLIKTRIVVREAELRKKTEEERKILQERLQRAEKMEALGTLAGGVAHDLNNVLGVVVGYAELVLMKADESSSIRPQLVNIMNGGLKAAAIVDDLLTLARRGVSNREVLNLNKIIADCQHSPEFANLSSHHPTVKIETDMAPDLLNISGSSVHLGKSLYNLISNASEAMPKGGIVTIRTANQYLDKPIQGYDQIQAGDYVVLSVSDTGEGISESDMKRIFEPFYTKKVMGRSGTGLGLAVVWGTVKDHHGYISVQSEEGKGSTFTLYFPVTREAITAEAVAIAVSEYMGSGESILVVDDVKEQRDLAAGMLRTLNYDVASVSSGEEAVAYMKDHQADLIILDMIMDPGMDGLDTYKQVLEIHPKQKAIIVSGFSESDRVRAAKGLGAGAYVRKPYIKENLGVVVRRELDRK